MDSIVPIIETSSATKGAQTFANKMTELENCFKKERKREVKKETLPRSGSRRHLRHKTF